MYEHNDINYSRQQLKVMYSPFVDNAEMHFTAVVFTATL